MLKAWHIAVAEPARSSISRLRALARGAAAWSPLFVGGAVLLTTELGQQYDHILSLLAVACWLVGAIYAIYRPERGLQDRLLGTWLIPR